MKKNILIVVIAFCLILPVMAESRIDTSQPDWDLRALVDIKWIMEIIDGTNSILEVYVREVIPEDPEARMMEITDEVIKGYRILKPENGIEYYAIFQDGNERTVLLRRADGSVFYGNSYLREGIFAIRTREDEPGVYYRDVLKWPLVIQHYPEDNYFYPYLDGVPESYSYPGKGVFYARFDNDENTMEGIYNSTRSGEEKFRMKKLPNLNWGVSMALAITPATPYGGIFNCFLRRIEPGVWESDGAFGIGYRLIFVPEKERILVDWIEDSWQGLPLYNFYLIPYDEVYTPEGYFKNRR